jgi:hypothetical protein
VPQRQRALPLIDVRDALVATEYLEHRAIERGLRGLRGPREGNAEQDGGYTLVTDCIVCGCSRDQSR